MKIVPENALNDANYLCSALVHKDEEMQKLMSENTNLAVRVNELKKMLGHMTKDYEMSQEINTSFWQVCFQDLESFKNIIEAIGGTKEFCDGFHKQMGEDLESLSKGLTEIQQVKDNRVNYLEKWKDFHCKLCEVLSKLDISGALATELRSYLPDDSYDL